MWTNENRDSYNRDRLRYPSDLTDAEWALVEPLIPPPKRGGNKRTVNIRDVLDGLMYFIEHWLPMASTSERSRTEEHSSPLLPSLDG